ncbi:MAG: hypothetical protein AB7P99_05885 [Vicinamibacterales bacterium]
MTPEQPDEAVQRLWRAQKTDGGEMSMQHIRERAAAFQRRWRVANLIEYGAAAWVVGASIWMASRAERPVVAVGMSLIAAGAVFVAAFMHRYGWTGRSRQAS